MGGSGSRPQACKRQRQLQVRVLRAIACRLVRGRRPPASGLPPGPAPATRETGGRAAGTCFPESRARARGLPPAPTPRSAFPRRRLPLGPRLDAPLLPGRAGGRAAAATLPEEPPARADRRPTGRHRRCQLRMRPAASGRGGGGAAPPTPRQRDQRPEPDPPLPGAPGSGRRGAAMPGRLLRGLRGWWRRYRYRFVPWVALNIGHNPRCLDGVLIDGNDKGLSKVVYRSCNGRDRLGPLRMSDSTWLTSEIQNPLAVGQYVNNCSNDRPANVCYQEFDVPAGFPVELKQYLPNTTYSCAQQRPLRCVVLVALRDIRQGEELFSNYYTIVS